MRKWAYLKDPLEYDDKQIYKVMVYETRSDGTYVFLYDSPEAQICVADEWHETVVDAADAWNKFIETDSWVVMDDPLPGCQDDGILPVRVKGRNIGKPEWGKYELLVDGKWVEYKE